ncbi:hypothetical protein [Dysgonomonas capnocytophagoides]|uniref:hypothetical protein n=1 Tax=Dysgonomonas capnocytophagoides TaxID=45254 RepID=UPI00291F487F|nr:hypothetical protein DCPSUM001_01440 [Dysgonomonas capnocytophagoides]
MWNKIIDNKYSIITFCLLITAVPYILSRPAFWDDLIFQNKGQIGDLIGGTTAPFIGILSIILLYITFKEQRKFNMIQKSASDLTILFEMQDRIIKLSSDIKFHMITNGQDAEELSTGLDRIENIDRLHLDGILSSEYTISEDEFNVLYGNVITIANLCILFHKIKSESSLNVNITNFLASNISIYSTLCITFFEYCKDNKVLIVGEFLKHEADSKDEYSTKLLANKSEQIDSVLADLRRI